MNKLVIGKKYKAKFENKGTSSRGEWELLSTTDEKDRNEITLFVTNLPSGMPREGGEFILNKIISITNGQKLSKTTGKWFQAISADVEVTYVAPDKSFDEAFDGENPFADDAQASGNPWDSVNSQPSAPWDDVDGELPF